MIPSYRLSASVHIGPGRFVMSRHSSLSRCVLWCGLTQFGAHNLDALLIYVSVREIELEWEHSSFRLEYPRRVCPFKVGHTHDLGSPFDP